MGKGLRSMRFEVASREVDASSDEVEIVGQKGQTFGCFGSQTRFA